MSVVPAMIAERLEWAQLTFASAVTVDAGAKKVTITRVTEAGVDEIFGAFPAVISVVEKINEPRYPSFKGIMAAKKKTVENMNLVALEITVENAWSVVIDASLRPPRAAGVTVTDDGTAADQLVSYLVEKKLI
jgi:electron transfer flavoprotein beta subunit